MKKEFKQVFRVLLLCLVLSLCMSSAVQAAGQKPVTIYKKAVKCYKNRDFDKARQYFQMLDKNADEACVRKMSRPMKKTYLKFLKKYVDKYGLKYSSGSSLPYVNSYYLTDIDKDKKPELIIDLRTCEADARAYVFSYINGKAVQIGVFYPGHSSLHYDPRGNGLIMVYGHMQGESVSTVKISSGKVVTKQWKISRTIEDGDDYMNFPYMLDGHSRWSDVRYLDYSPLQ